MDQQIRLGKFLISNRVLFFVALFFLVASSPTQKILSFESFRDFILTFGKRWDGNSYTFIADHWYVTSGPEKYFIVFPPLYPIAIKILDFFINNPVISGMIVSNTFFILGMIVFYRLLLLDYKKKFALLVIVLVSIFPTTLFFSVAYPESLFFFLFVSSFYLCRKKKFLTAGVLAGLSVLTRPFGVVLVPAIIFQAFLQKDLNFKWLVFFLFTLVVPTAIYLSINYATFGNPFTFSEFLRENWQKSFALPWEGILASWKRGLFTQELDNYKFLVGYGEAIASTFAWLSIALGIKHWGIKSPYLLYLVLGTLFFTSTGFILSAPRYLLSLPPFFILLAKTIDSNKYLKISWIIVSVFLLFYISHKFSLGEWTF